MKKMFGKIFGWIKKIDYRHYIFSALVLLSLAVLLFCYRLPLERTWESVCDFADSVTYWASGLSLEEGETLPEATIATVPDVDLTRVLPFSVEDIVRKAEHYAENFFNEYNFKLYTYYAFKTIFYFSLFALPVGLFAWCLLALFNAFVMRPAKKGQEAQPSKAFVRFQKLTERPFCALRTFFDDMASFSATHKVYKRLVLSIWFIALNMATIVISTVAIYFYFSASFDFVALWTFFIRTVIDALIMFSGAALPFWIALAWLLLCKLREKIGYKRLEAMEQCNKEIVKKLPVATMVEGEPGAGKTTFVTGAGITGAINLRDDALEVMLERDLRYPAFPWAAFRKDLKDAITRHETYNLYTIEGWIQRRHARFYLSGDKADVWGYEYPRYAMSYNSDLKLFSIWEDVREYAKAFFVYSMNSSLIISNFAVRDDLVFDKNSPFPIFDHNIFKRDPRVAHLESAYSHILDWDFVRLGTRMCKDAMEQGALDFGIVLITEIGKERGNMNALKELKKLVDECNQKNDRFEDYLKMIRHPAVIANRVFIKVITDDQRAMAWAADGRELCDIVNIVEVLPRRVALPFFTYAEMAYDFFRPRYDEFLIEYEASGKGLTLPAYIYRAFWSFFFSRHDRTVNRFTFEEKRLQIGTAKEGDGKQARLVSYFHLDKKEYSDRFATNCHKGLFSPAFARACKGLADIEIYTGIDASNKQLNKQHSHFISAVRKSFNDQNNKFA